MAGRREVGWERGSLSRGVEALGDGYGTMRAFAYLAGEREHF